MLAEHILVLKLIYSVFVSITRWPFAFKTTEGSDKRKDHGPSMGTGCHGKNAVRTLDDKILSDNMSNLDMVRLFYFFLLFVSKYVFSMI